MVNETLEEKVGGAIASIRLAADISETYYKKPLLIAYSGGKDSDVLADLAVRSGAGVEFSNRHTSVDAPETVYHIRRVFERLRASGYEARVRYPRDETGRQITMWRLIEEKGFPPTRLARYCCEVLKEGGGNKRITALGVRADESRARSERSEYEVIGTTKKKGIGLGFEHVREVFDDAKHMDEVWDCSFITAAKKNANLVCNPIIGWSEDDVWAYIRENQLVYNPLYDRGYRRVGCVGCPLAGRKTMMKELVDFPKYKQIYMHTFERMLKKRWENGKKTGWQCAEDVFAWWTQDPDHIPGQMRIELLDDFVQSETGGKKP